MIGSIAMVQVVGGKILAAFSTAGYDLVMLARALAWIRSAWSKRTTILLQCYAAGIESLPVVIIVGIFTGMILALGAGIELARFGQQELIGALVSVVMAREMGPFMTALILTANVGSSISAEIGTMKVSEEIEALEVMSIDVNRFLVMPRLVALMIVVPLLTAVANVVGNIGAAVVGYYQLGVTFSAYYFQAMLFLTLKDVYTGLLKALIFGIIIATIACGKGLRTQGGAIGVGQATRTCVIACFLMIMAVGYFLTAIFYGDQLG